MTPGIQKTNTEMGNKQISTTDEWANGISKDLCECCRNQKWKLSLDKKYSKEKIFVCEKCFQNIENKNLLPIEWYHLAVIHGLSSDDEEFYREDSTSKSKKFKREINTSTPRNGRLGHSRIAILGNNQRAYTWAKFTVIPQRKWCTSSLNPPPIFKQKFFFNLSLP
jgi:hypothetical protein